jgi:hypothetical protein
MKLAHLFVAAALCSSSAALAQTTPSPTSPNTSNPNAVPSGTAPVPSDPKGAVSAGEVFTKGSPTSASDKRAMKRSRKDKGSMTTEKRKMKGTM